jgi:hypothetical protein
VVSQDQGEAENPQAPADDQAAGGKARAAEAAGARDSRPPAGERESLRLLRRIRHILGMVILILVLLAGIILLLAMFRRSQPIRDRSRAGRGSLEAVMLVRPQLPERDDGRR